MPAVAGKGLHTTTLYVAFLDCGHEVSFSVGEPTAGDTIWCGKCYMYANVRHLSQKYGVSCNNCRYARNYGGKLTAQTKAAAHAIRFLGHEVEAFGPDGFAETHCHQPQTLQFDIPPF